MANVNRPYLPAVLLISISCSHHPQAVFHTGSLSILLEKRRNHIGRKMTSLLHLLWLASTFFFIVTVYFISIFVDDGAERELLGNR